MISPPTIPPLPLGNILFDAFMISDPFGQFIVGVLVFASIIAWSIMFHKYIELQKVAQSDRLFLRAFNARLHPLELFLEENVSSDSPMGKVYLSACHAVRREFEARAKKEKRDLHQIDLSQERLTALQIDAIRKVAECAAADQYLLLENMMTLLGSVYTLAPMLGLFGTVWGVMVAFHGMGAQGMANLSAVAPGVSSALLTTVIGLLVAMPSAYGCNKLNDHIRFLGVQLENFTDTFAARLQQSFLYE